MGETRIRRAVAGLAGVALLTASFVAAAPGAAQEPVPTIFASMTYADPVNGGPPDYIWANGMTPGEAIHLELDFEDDGTLDYTKDTFADVNGQWAFDDIGTSGRLLPGSHITLTGTDPEPDWVKDLVVQSVRVEFADPYSDRAGGIAFPGATVHLSVPPPGGGPDLVSVDLTADGNGWWHHDFAATGFDLTTEHVVSAWIDDGDGDLSSHAEDAFRPAVHALIGAGPGGYAWLYGWPEGIPVSVEADFDNDGTVDETIPETAYMFGPGVMFSGDFGQLQVGSRVTVTAVNGDAPFRWEKVVVLEPVSVDGWSAEEDWIEGTAPPERGLRVQISAQGPTPAFVEISSDVNGYWRADFAGQWDVQPGTGFDVRLPDADGDHTGIQFQVPSAPVMLNAWPTTGLWDGAPVNVYVGNMTPNSNAFVSVNVASDPFNQFAVFPNGIPIDEGGFGHTSVDVPRYIGEFDCASAPGACILVTADQHDPFGRNASVPLSFGRVDLFRYTPNDPQDPGAGGTVGDPITSSDLVAHTEWIWAQGSGFQPGGAYELDQCKDAFGTELCRSTWGSHAYAMADESGTFGVPLQVGRNVFGPWGTQLQVWLDQSFDLRDGQTVVVNATGLPPEGWLADCGPGECWVGARPSGGWEADWTPYRSDPLTFSGDPVPVTVHVAQLLKQQLEAIVHAAPAVGSEREVTWDPWTGTLAYPFTAVERWLEPDLTWGPWSPEPVEGGFYDCADELAFDPATGAQEPVRCGFSVEVREGDELYGGPFFTWVDAQFARFDLTAAVTSAATSARPAGVTLTGQVTCTGFMPEQYLVTVEGTITQTSTKGRRPSTITQSFATTVTCSGTMANPGKAIWTVFVPGAFKAGAATITLDVSSAGFTRSDAPLHVETTVTLTSPPKGKG